ncbi:MAG: 50S ribosomal protein L25 [Patescibacteria group bacterium]|nr:50S ribosomal protein L25 [Patescibacteria group bacterium]
MDLAVKMREGDGKKASALRQEGFIPAELYGHGLKNKHLAVPAREFNKVFKEAGENTVVTLHTGAEKHPVLIYDVQRDFLTGEVAHVDFYAVKMDEKLKAKVPLEFTGEAPAVREKGAVLNKSMTEIEVEAFPQDLPHRLAVDISGLDDFGKTIYVKDLAVPRGVEILVEAETAVITATEPMKEEEVAAPAPEAAVGEVKVETEEKKAERAAEKEAKEEK